MAVATRRRKVLNAIEWPARASTSRQFPGRKIYRSKCGRFQIVHFAGDAGSKRFAVYVRNVITGEFPPAIEDFSTLAMAKVCCQHISDGVRITSRHGIYHVKAWRTFPTGDGGWVFLTPESYREYRDAHAAMRTYLSAKGGAS